MKRFVFLLAAILLAAAAFAAIDPGVYEVNVSSTLNVRNARAGLEGVLPDGALIEMTACEGDWAQVTLDDGRIGYVSGQYLQPIISSPVASSGASYSPVGFSELRHFAPFAILLFAVFAFIGMRTGTHQLFHMGCFLWGATELFMFGAGSDSALVWFCDCLLYTSPSPRD